MCLNMELVPTLFIYLFSRKAFQEMLELDAEFASI